MSMLTRALSLVALPVLVVTSCSHVTRDEVREDRSAARASEPFEVHEWGTFTSMQGANGTSLDGLQHESEALPSFVHSSISETPSPFRAYGDTSLGVPVHHCTGKMEPPVMYFYAPSSRHVDVHVDFAGGMMTEWYPSARVTPTLDPRDALDLAKIERSSLDWSIELTPYEPTPTRFPLVSSDDPWTFAREVHAATVTTSGTKAEPGESERYVFYRGLGRLDLPIDVVVATDSLVVVRNRGDATIGKAFVLDVHGDKGRYVRIDDLGAQSTRPLSMTETKMRPKDEVVAALQQEMTAALVAEGLYQDEARAMIRTWSRTWFSAEGTRVIYLEPRGLTDRVLPLTITPAPDRLVRVLVGRHEFLTQEAEQEIEGALRDRLSPNASIRDAAMERLATRGRFLEPSVRRLSETTTDPLVRESALSMLAQFP